MDAYAIRPKTPYVTRKQLKRTPASEETRKRNEFIDSYEFSLTIENGKLIVKCLDAFNL